MRGHRLLHNMQGAASVYHLDIRQWARAPYCRSFMALVTGPGLYSLHMNGRWMTTTETGDQMAANYSRG